MPQKPLSFLPIAWTYITRPVIWKLQHLNPSQTRKCISSFSLQTRKLQSENSTLKKYICWVPQCIKNYFIASHFKILLNVEWEQPMQLLLLHRLKWNLMLDIVFIVGLIMTSWKWCFWKHVYGRRICELKRKMILIIQLI